MRNKRQRGGGKRIAAHGHSSSRQAVKVRREPQAGADHTQQEGRYRDPGLLVIEPVMSD